MSNGHGHGNNRLHVPGQVQVGCNHIPTTQAFPSTLPVSGPTTLQAIVFGGLTKLEWMVGQIDDTHTMPANIVKRARELLEACDAEQRTQIVDEPNIGT